MSEIFPFLLSGLWTTVLITFGSFTMGVILGVPVAFAGLSKNLLLRWVATAYIEILRGVPPIAWMLTLYFGLSSIVRLPPTLAAVIALGAVSTAYLAENYKAGIRSVANGQNEAADALGLNSRDTFWRVVAPQGIGIALPPSAGYAVGLLKDSAVASVIGAADVAFQALTLNQQGNPGLPIFLAAGLLYFAISIPMAVLARRADTYVRGRSAA
jgi:His/Glu/Gln/Arg/opine family amino acid ABC transporter permease subunit